MFEVIIQSVKLLFGGDSGNLIVRHLNLDEYLYFFGLYSSCVESFEEIQSDRFLGPIGIRTAFEIECIRGKSIIIFV